MLTKCKKQKSNLKFSITYVNYFNSKINKTKNDLNNVVIKNLNLNIVTISIKNALNVLNIFFLVIII